MSPRRTSISHLMLLAAVLAASALLALLAGPARAAGCTTSWTNAGGGDWNNGANWDHGIPSAGSDACITLDGTYAVQLIGTIANVNSLTLGGASGTQTLSLAGDASKNTNLTADTTATIGTHGALSLTSVDPAHTSAFWAKGGTTSNGAITAAVGAGSGVRDVRGSLTNNGTIAIQHPTSYGSGPPDTLVNHGAIDLGARLDVLVGSAFTSGTGGSLTGTDRLVLHSAKFNLVAGTITNPNPIELEDSSLNVVGTNAAGFLWHGSNGTLTGGLRGAGQKLTVEGTCTAQAAVLATSSYTNKGRIVLTSTGCPTLAQLWLGTSSNTLTNAGTLSVQQGAGGARSVGATLENRSKMDIGAGTTLDTFAFRQLSGGTLKTSIGGLASYGRLTAGPATLDGTLAIARDPAFAPVLGDTFSIVSGSSLSGVFAKATGAVIARTKYFSPTYTSTQAQLVVANASLAGPSSAQAGTVATYVGSGFPPNSLVALSVKSTTSTTAIGAVTTDPAGGFTAQVTVPPPGTWNVVAKSRLTGVTVASKLTSTP